MNRRLALVREPRALDEPADEVQLRPRVRAPLVDIVTHCRVVEDEVDELLLPVRARVAVALAIVGCDDNTVQMCYLSIGKRAKDVRRVRSLMFI